MTLVQRSHGFQKKRGNVVFKTKDPLSCTSDTRGQAQGAWDEDARVKFKAMHHFKVH